MIQFDNFVINPKQLRAQIATIVHNSGEGHIPSSFSIVDILSVIYSKHINLELVRKRSPNRDVFILSKGHGALALYVVLVECGLMEANVLTNYSQPKSLVAGHPDTRKHFSVEASTGSLGHGLPIAVGVALGKKLANLGGKTFVLMGDGESHEGTIWESAHFAANHELRNLVVFVDFNQSGMQLLPKEDLVSKFRAFGWSTLEIDGHNFHEISASISQPREDNSPLAIIARTTKGKGSRSLEGHGSWHHKIPSKQELQTILEELENVYP